MSNNYNAAAFVKGSDLYEANADNLQQMNTNGRCNNCKFFNFGKRRCTKTDESNRLVRPDMLPITYSEQTSKGTFIHVLKPLDCNDFTPKGKKVDMEAKNETVKEES